MHAVSHGNDRACDGGIVLAGGDFADEIAVYFQGVDGKALEVIEGGITHTEIVDRNVDSQIFQLMQGAVGLIGVVHHGAFRQFDFQKRGVGIFFRDDVADGFRQMIVAKLSCRKMTATRKPFIPRFDHSAIWLHAAFMTQSPMERIKPLASATGMNCCGRISPNCGWRHLNSASRPMMRPDSSSICG